MPRPSFSVVAGTLVVLVGFGVIRRYLAPLIPPPNAAVSSDAADYLRQGEIQAIPWRPLSANLIAEARRVKRPLLIAFGSEASPIARDLDERAFTDPEIVQYIADKFVAARVDLAASPAWRGALAPIARTGVYRDEGFQLAVVAPDGRPVVAIAPPAVGLRFDRDALLVFLDSARATMRIGGEYPLERELEVARETLRGERRELPALDAALSIRTRTDRSTGLVAVPGGERLSPWAIEAIGRAGERLFARDALLGLARSPMCDPLDGGVFVSVASSDDRGGILPRRIECTKSLLQNAALAETAARVAAATGDPAVDAFARRTMAWCARILARGGAAFVVSDQELDGFSSYYSLTRRRVQRAGLTSDDDSFRARLGADRDPQNLGRLDAPPTRIVAEDLRTLARKGRHPQERNARIEAVQATAIARLMGAARLAGDEALAVRLSAQLEALEAETDRAEADLPLLLALADAHFADFLANGRVSGLDLAARDLLRSIRRYGSPSGALSAGEGLPGLGFSPEAPDLADGTREASAAVAVRLANAVGRTLETGTTARELRRWAISCAARYAPMLGSDADHPNGAPNPESAAFLSACAEVSDTSWRVVAASDPVRAATDELRRFPYDLVVPAIGNAAPEVPRDRFGVSVRSVPSIP